jgi:hypothetical protein
MTSGLRLLFWTGIRAETNEERNVLATDPPVQGISLTSQSITNDALLRPPSHPAGFPSTESALDFNPLAQFQPVTSVTTFHTRKARRISTHLPVKQ